jgi:glycosyltransferase involved in cell wall biosynthesis
VSGVSVVVCTLDRPDALARCLRALRECTPPPAQIVVVDQGARPVVLEGVDYVHMTERGVSRGRNRGARAAEHELLAFTDDDCVPAPEWIGGLERGYDDGADGVTGRVLPLPGVPGGVPVSSRTSTARRTFSGPGQTPWDIGTGGNLSLRRSAFEAVRGFDEALGPGTPARSAEDVDLLYRLANEGLTIRYEPDAVVYHELKTRRARVGGRYAYGFGLGTVLARHAARGDEHAPALRRSYAAGLARRAASGLRHADGWPALEGALTLAGMVAGSARRDRP